MTIMPIIIVHNISDLGPFDVLCGRDKESYNNVGNRRFRLLINVNLPKYLKCKTRSDRSRMILQLTYELQNSCAQFRFLKRVKGNTDCYTLSVLDHKQSREKIAHALRDAASQHRSMEKKQTVERKEVVQSISPTSQVLAGYYNNDNDNNSISKNSNNSNNTAATTTDTTTNNYYYKYNTERQFHSCPSRLSTMTYQNEAAKSKPIVQRKDSLRSIISESLAFVSDGRQIQNGSSSNNPFLNRNSDHKVQNYPRRSSTQFYQNEAADVEELFQETSEFRLSEIFDYDFASDL